MKIPVNKVNKNCLFIFLLTTTLLSIYFCNNLVEATKQCSLTNSAKSNFKKLLELTLEKQLLELDNQGLNSFNDSQKQLDQEIKVKLFDLDSSRQKEFLCLMIVSQEYLENSIKKYLNKIKIYNYKISLLTNNIKALQLKINAIEYQINICQAIINKNFMDRDLLLKLKKQKLQNINNIHDLQKQIKYLEDNKTKLRNQNIIIISSMIIR